jgi:N-acetylmuramoyl-L-alanine amidase
MRHLLLLLSLIVLLPGGVSAKVTPLGIRPEWKRFDGYQETITRSAFVDLLDSVYAPHGAWKDVIKISGDSAKITTDPDFPPYVLRFAASSSSAKPVPRFWRKKSQLPPPAKGKPLSGLKVAIDPGHIGGKWAKMEERWFQIGNGKPVAEGDMTLKVAKLLEERLKKLGADVRLTRKGGNPLSKLRPDKLLDAARRSLADNKRTATAFALQKESEKLFYRTAEIRSRAWLVNAVVEPDVVVCLHFNAEAWGDPANPSLVDKTHLHFLVTGAWSKDELAYEDQRFEMLHKLLGRSLYEEKAVGAALVKSMVAATRLSPFIYRGNNAVRVGDGDYIWGRNLLANRLFKCPVVYAEPYVMNSRKDYARIQAGDYKGTKTIGGVKLKSIYREYADAIADGFVAYYSNR